MARSQQEALICQIHDNLLHRLANVQLVGVNHHLRLLWRLIGIIDTGEVLEFALFGSNTICREH